jgi:hypothetical protein
MTFVGEEEITCVPVLPEPQRKSQKGKQKKKKKKSAVRESKGRFVIWLKTAGVVQRSYVSISTELQYQTHLDSKNG